MDVIVILAVLTFFVAAAGYVVFCERVVGAPPATRRDGPESDSDG